MRTSLRQTAGCLLLSYVLLSCQPTSDADLQPTKPTLPVMIPTQVIRADSTDELSNLGLDIPYGNIDIALHIEENYPITDDRYLFTSDRRQVFVYFR